MPFGWRVLALVDDLNFVPWLVGQGCGGPNDTSITCRVGPASIAIIGGPAADNPIAEIKASEIARPVEAPIRTCQLVSLKARRGCAKRHR